MYTWQAWQLCLAVLVCVWQVYGLEGSVRYPAGRWVWLVIFILAGKVGKQIWRPIWVYSAVFALAFGGACIVFFMRLSLLPEESEILFPADKKQQRKIRVHVWV